MEGTGRGCDLSLTPLGVDTEVGLVWRIVRKPRCGAKRFKVCADAIETPPLDVNIKFDRKNCNVRLYCSRVLERYCSKKRGSFGA